MAHLESFADLLAVADGTGLPLDAIFLDAGSGGARSCPRERVFETFLERWAVMKDSVRRGLAGGKSFSGLVGGDAKKVIEFTRDGDIAGGRLVARASPTRSPCSRRTRAWASSSRLRRPAPQEWSRELCSRSPRSGASTTRRRRGASSSPAGFGALVAGKGRALRRGGRLPGRAGRGRRDGGRRAGVPARRRRRHVRACGGADAAEHARASRAIRSRASSRCRASCATASRRCSRWRERRRLSPASRA